MINDICDKGTEMKRMKKLVKNEKDIDMITEKTDDEIYVRFSINNDTLKILMSNTFINSIYIGSNGITDEAAKTIGYALEYNTTLTTLIICFNRIGNEGAKAIGHALERNDVLTTLDISHNRIGTEGGVAIFTALEYNATLTNLEISFNDIGNECADAIGHVLENKCCTLRFLRIVGNQIDEEGYMIIKKSLINKWYIKHIEGIYGLKHIYYRNVWIRSKMSTIADVADAVDTCFREYYGRGEKETNVINRIGFALVRLAEQNDE